MAINVIEAFTEFMKETVNLDRADTITARKSRNWLMDRIHDLPNKDASFPKLLPSEDVFFGSFERKTKKRALDDIDIMVCLNAQQATYLDDNDTFHMYIDNENSPLYNLRHDNSRRINSKRVLNKFVNVLSNIDQYRLSTIGRKGEAATLDLSSYDWTFDIVPCFMTHEDIYGKDFYIIPDGNGNWKKTDPRVDRSKVELLVELRGVGVLDVIRLVKYWNQRPTMPSMPSYALENMVLDYYSTRGCSEFPDLEFKHFITYMERAIFSPVDDPKGIQGDLNTLDIAEKIAISNRCGRDLAKAIEARQFEDDGAMERSINRWAEVFGPHFPNFS